MAEDPDLERTEPIFDALDGDDPQAALSLALDAIRDAPEADPILHYLCGRALMELDRPAAAATELRYALDIDPEEPEFRVFAAWASFRACGFDEAWTLLENVDLLDERLPETHHVRALLLERRGDLDAADRGFERAAEIDPDWFVRPTRLTADEFANRLSAARDGLDERFRAHLDRIDVIVDDLPSDALLQDPSAPLDPEQLLGLFDGIPLGEESGFSPGGELPPRIFLFKRNLERFVASGDELSEQIQVTLYHELGHYLGMDEAELEELGYG